MNELFLLLVNILLFFLYLLFSIFHFVCVCLWLTWLLFIGQEAKLNQRRTVKKHCFINKCIL